MIDRSIGGFMCEDVDGIDAKDAERCGGFSAEGAVDDDFLLLLGNACQFG